MPTYKPEATTTSMRGRAAPGQSTEQFPAMTRTRPPGGRTPDELTTLLEEALILADTKDLEPLFETHAVFLTRSPGRETHGNAAIATVLTQRRAGSYAAAPELVLRARDLTLTIGTGIHVTRRGRDHTWRYAISALDLEEPARREPLPSSVCHIFPWSGLICWDARTVDDKDE